VTTLRRRVLLILVTTGLGCVAGLCIAEVAVRLLLPYNTPDTVRRHSLQYIASVFARHRLEPDQSVHTAGAWGRVPQPGGGEPDIVINERGYRGAPIAIPKPAGVVRIVVLGGSSVFDIYASEGHDWPRLLEDDLRRSGHPEVEVINGGVPGHTAADSLGRLYAQMWMYEPDYVLVYDVWNDLKYMSVLDNGHPLIEDVAPFDATADPFQNYRGWLDRLLAHSQVYVKLRNQVFMWRLRPGVEGASRTGPRARGDLVSGLSQYRLILSLLVDAARDIGATPVLVTEATLVDAGNGPEEKSRIHYEYQGMDHEALVRGFQDCYRVIHEVGFAKHADVLDLTATLNGRPDLFADQVHTTAAGSQAIASAVARFLQKGMASAPPRP
jgi:lysophospholipase L1-like esterase